MSEMSPEKEWLGDMSDADLSEALKQALVTYHQGECPMCAAEDAIELED